MINIRVVGWDIEVDISWAIQKSLIQSTQLIRDKAIWYAPVKRWHLRRSITTKVKDTTWAVWTNLIYAPIQEYGWVIKPKRKKYLAWKSNWKWHFAKQVRIKPKKYMQKAMDTSLERIQEYFDTNIKKVLWVM